MENEILKELKKIEEENNIKIIFASDMGNRTLGYSTEESDYDLRFIYIQKPENYLKLKEGKDIIQKKVLIDNGIKTDFDFVGFDIKKALNLITSTNIQVWQLLYSSKVYIATDSSNEMKKISADFFELKKFYHQYAGIISNNYKRKIKNQKEIKSKYYIIELVRIASILKIEKEFKYDFSEGAEESYKNLPENISKKLKLMVSERKEGEETVVSDEELNKYIELIIKDLQKKADKTAAIDKNIEKINRFFYDIISNEIINQYFYNIFLD